MQSEKLLQRLAEDKCQPTWQPTCSVDLSTKIAWTTQGVECTNLEVNGYSHSKRHAILLVGRVARLLERRYSFHKPKAGARKFSRFLDKCTERSHRSCLLVMWPWPDQWVEDMRKQLSHKNHNSPSHSFHQYYQHLLDKNHNSPSHFSHQYHQHLLDKNHNSPSQFWTDSRRISATFCIV